MEQMASESIDHNHGTPRMQLFINDARREFEESGKVRNLPFWVYLVTCKTTLPKFHEAADAKTQDGVTVLKVWRRYSDFQWLREKLFKSFGGFIIPPIPEKDFFGTLDKVADLVAGPEMDDWRMNDFVSLRLGALNKFVHALARSSVAESDLVRNFLCLSKHEEWNTYKAHVSETIKQHHVSYTSSNPVSTVKNMFGKVKKMVNKNKSPEGSSGESGGSAKPSSVAHLDPRVARINAQSHEFEAHFAKLYTASMLLLTRGKTRQKAAPVVFDENAENAKEVVPIWLLSVGHKVCGVEGNVGTVRFVGLVNEVSHVGIEWTEAVGHCDGVAADGQRYFQTEHNHASFVLPQVVFYPPSGVSDPAILAAREAGSQIETHLLPYGSRAQQLLTELVDMTYFWRMYAIGVNEVIAYLADLEASRAHVQLEVNKETRPEKLCILREKLENVTKVQKEHTSTFCEQFQKYFQPEHRRSMRKILELYVAVQKELCVIGASWNVKIRPVVSLLDVTRNQTTE